MVYSLNTKAQLSAIMFSNSSNQMWTNQATIIMVGDMMGDQLDRARSRDVCHACWHQERVGCIKVLKSYVGRLLERLVDKCC